MTASIVQYPLTRRRLIKSAAGACALAAAPTLAFGRQNRLGGHLFEDVLAYYKFGEHRTGGAANRAAADWISGRFSAIGARGDHDTWRLRSFDLRKHELTIEGQSIASFPLWLPKPTGPDGVEGKLALFDPAGAGQPIENAIAIVPVRGHSVHDRSLHASRINEVAVRGAKAAIVADPSTDALRKELITHDVPGPYSEKAWPIPTVTIAAKDLDEVKLAAQSGQRATIVIEGDAKELTEATNLVGVIDRGGPFTIVSAAYSGWLGCAGERGAGLAVLMGLAGWAAQSGQKSSYIFLAHAGAELGLRGRERFLKEMAPAPENVRCWVELGAGVATWRWKPSIQGLVRDSTHGGVENLVASQHLVSKVASGFRALPGIEPRSHGAPQDFRDIFQAGYSGMTLYGGNYFNRSFGDDPKNTHPQILESVAASVIRALTEIETAWI